MSVRPVYVDASVFLYALGGAHPLKEPCRRIIADQGLELCASVEMVQEVVFHRMRVGERDRAVQQAERVAQACRLLPFDRQVLDLALILIQRHDVGGRDAAHAATALANGIPEIISPDPDFDAIEGLSRIDPRDMG